MIEGSILDHCTFDYTRYKRFISRASSLIESKIINYKKILDEMINFNKPQAFEIEEILKKNHSILEGIIYLYSTNLIYKPYNEAFKQHELHKVELSGSYCFYETLKEKKYHYKGDYLFRGLYSLDYSQFEKSKKKPLFFPGFLSTSKVKKVAKNFSNGGIILKIKLSKTKPHPHICLEESLSKYPEEYEVLLMPYIPLYVIDINESKNLISLRQCEKIELNFNYLNKIYFKSHIETFYTIMDIKELIEKQIGLSKISQVFELKSEIMENDNKIIDYDIQDNDIIYIRPNHIRLIIDNDDFSIEMSRTESLWNLKEQLCLKFGISDCIFFYKEKILRNKNTLIFYKIDYGDTLYVYKRLGYPFALITYKLTLEVFDKYDAYYNDPASLIYDEIDSILQRPFKLLCNNKIIQNDLSTLEENHLDSGSIIYVYCNIDTIHPSLFESMLINIIIINSLNEHFSITISWFLTLKELKKILIKKNIEAREKNLFIRFDNKILYSNKRIVDYNIQDNSILLIFFSTDLDIYIKTPTGKLILIDVKSSDSINNVKCKIKNKEKMPTDQQHLKFSGYQLEDDKILKDYNIQNNSIIDLVIKAKDFLKIYIEIIGKNTITINADSSDSLQDIQEIIREKEGISINQQWLIYSGKQLENDKTLSYYNIQNNSTVFLIVRSINPLRIYIKYMSTNEFEVDLSYNSKIVLDLYEIIMNCKLNSIQIRFKDTFLSPSKSLNFYGVKNNSLLELVKVSELIVKDLSLNTIIIYYEKLDSIAYIKKNIQDTEEKYLINIQRLYCNREFLKIHDLYEISINKRCIFLNVNCDECNSFDNSIQVREDFNNILCCIKCYENIINHKCSVCNTKERHIKLYSNQYFCKEHYQENLLVCENCNLFKSSVAFDITYEMLLCKECKIRSIGLPPGHLQQIRKYQYEKGKILSIICLENMRNLIALTSDNKILIVNIESNQIHLEYQLNTSGVNSIKPTKDCKFLLYGGDNGILYFWNFEIFQTVEAFKVSDSSIIIIEISSKYAIINCDNGYIYIYDILTMYLVSTLRNESGYISCMGISLDEKYLFTGLWTNEIQMWSLIEYKLLCFFIGHKSWVSCLQVTSGNKYLISGSGDRNIIIWDMNLKKKIKKIKAHKHEIRGITISQNGRYFLSVSQDKSISVWSLISYELVYRVIEDCGWITCIKIADDDKYVYIGSNDGSINEYVLI